MECWECAWVGVGLQMWGGGGADKEGFIVFIVLHKTYVVGTQ